MSNVGYSEIIEYIAEEVIAFADNKDQLEADVDRYMENLTQAVQERVEELGNKEDWSAREECVVECTYTSVWDGGVTIESPARANLETRTIEIESSDDVDGVETLEREFVTIDGKEYPATNESNRNDYSEGEQQVRFFYH